MAGWFTHDDADPTVDTSGEITARDSFVQHNGCDATNTQIVALSDGITACTGYNQCTTGNRRVVWCPVPGEGHAIPRWAGAELAKFLLRF
jgi:hypothetical protein